MESRTTGGVNGHDRAETCEIIDAYLVPGIDLVTIQLSENVSDMTTFQSDYVELVKHIQEKIGLNAQIVIIDDFWDESKGEIKKTVAEETGVEFCDLFDIRGNKAYQLGIGATVYGTDGEEHINEHASVAGHPNDEGMKEISDRVLEIIKK